MSAKSKVKSNEHVVQAVLVADPFEEQFVPLSDDLPLSLFPVLNKPLIDYTLEFLSLGGVEETFLFCCSHVAAIKRHISKSVQEAVGWSVNMKVHVLVSESCRSLGDCLRDLDAKGLLRSDFVLLEPGVLSNVDLRALLKKHSDTCQSDRGAAMTLIFQETGLGQRSLSAHDEVLIAVNHQNRVLFHQKLGGKSGRKKVNFPLETFVDHPSVALRHNIKDCGVAVCSAAVLPLFSDNFDFQTKDDFVRCLLLNEEIMGSTVYCHILTGDSYGGAARDWSAYHAITADLKNRWICPLTASARRNRFIDDDAAVAVTSQLPPATASLRRSAVGARATVGERVTLEDAYVFDDVILEDDVTVTQSVIGPRCRVMRGAKITAGSILGAGVVVDAGLAVEGALVQAQPDDDAVKLGERAYRLREPEAQAWRCARAVTSPGDSSDDSFSASDDELSHTRSPPPDDTKLFFTEVVDSLTRGFDDKLLCDNLILEINSSRYAYNVAVKEVNFNVIKAILVLSLGLSREGAYFARYAKFLDYFAPVLRNYVKNRAAMLDCLQAFEEVADSDAVFPDKWSLFTLKYFYEKDYLTDEDVILGWYDKVDVDSRLFGELKPFVEWLREAEEEDDSDE